MANRSDSNHDYPIRGLVVALFPLCMLVSPILGLILGLIDLWAPPPLGPFASLAASVSFGIAAFIVLGMRPLKYEERSEYPVYRLFVVYAFLACGGAAFGFMVRGLIATVS
jgi:hypothetical protein